MCGAYCTKGHNEKGTHFTCNFVKLPYLLNWKAAHSISKSNNKNAGSEIP
jgi:hypothetical protein